MSGPLTHSPAEIVRRLLIDLGQGLDPTGETSDVWPVYVSQEPDKPDSVITVYDTTGIKQGRFQIDGETQEHFGLQVRVRDPRYEDGWTKARAVAVAMDESVALANVTIGGSQYTVYAISRISGPLAIGKDVASSRREVFTINVTASIRQTA